jgi:exonuclease SbcC
MKTSHIVIKNLFGIAEKTLDGSSVEITGTNGVGKTSVIDAIRYALTNSSDRDYVVRQGAAEGEILIETDTGLSISRKKRTAQSDYKQVRENGRDIPSPESFLRDIFTPLQIDPVAFTQMDKNAQNRIILDLIEFDWDLNWIKNQFGEIPPGIDYKQNILQVLNDIQAENGTYFQARQDVNRDIRNKLAFVADISKDIPAGYQAEKWDQYDIGAAYRKLEQDKDYNSNIQRAKAFRDSYKNKLRCIEADRDIAITAERLTVTREREGLLKSIERMRAEIQAAEDKLAGLNDKLKSKMDLIDSQFETAKAKLDKDVQVADEYADMDPKDVSGLTGEVELAESMKKHLNEYGRMKRMQDEIESLKVLSDEYTRKIELARTLPGEILKTATIPVAGLTVENGIPLINGLPVSNLSEGEQLSLCVDVTISKPGTLQIILLDGIEKLSDENRKKLYAKCKSKGLQFIATRTTNSSELEVTVLC